MAAAEATMTDVRDIHPGPTIREAADADGPAIAALVAGVFAEYENCPFLPEEFPELAAPAAYYAGKGGVLWVVEAGGRVVGSLAVAPSWRQGQAELFKVYLAREWRGRGIAGTLLDRASTWARAAGATAMVLWSDTRFVDGHRFYRRRGFRQLPGARALHDAGLSLEFAFSRDLG
jgi:putative acetyltransferase